MANFGGHVLTRAGQNLLAKLAATSGTLSYSSIKFGDGVLGSTLPTELTALISVKESVEPSRIVQRTANGRWNITGVLDNAKITTGFFLREWGVFARDPNTSVEVLLLYANAGSTAEYIPAYAGGDTTTYIEKEMTAACVVSSGITVNTEISSELYIPQREKGQPNGVATLANGVLTASQAAKSIIDVSASRTLAISDANKILKIGSYNVTLTIPTSTNVNFPEGTSIDVTGYRDDSKITFAPESGVSIYNNVRSFVGKNTVRLTKIGNPNAWAIEGIYPNAHIHDVTDLTNAVRSKKLAAFSNDYTDVVVPLCSLDNTDPNAESFFQGQISCIRFNGVDMGRLVNVYCQKIYNSTDVHWSIDAVLPYPASRPVRAATFTYNAKKYFGLYFYNAPPTKIDIVYGRASDWNIIDTIAVFNNKTSAKLNTEIMDSLVYLDNSKYQSRTFYGDTYIQPLGTGTRYKIWHEGNDGTGSGLDAGLFAGKQPYEYSKYLGAASGTEVLIWIDSLAIGTVGTFLVPNTMTPIPGKTEYYNGIILGNNAANEKCVVLVGRSSGKVYMNSKSTAGWASDWGNAADGGNADTVDGKHASDFAPASHTHAASKVTAGTLAGQVKANTDAQGALDNAQIRDIYATTTDLTAGVTALATGTFAAVYE